MSCRTRSFFPIAAIALALLTLPAFPAIAAKPLKVYILAGQSNMEGHAKVETFDYIGDDPATAPLLKEMRGPDGKPRVCEQVWISYLTGSRTRQRRGLRQADGRLRVAQQPDRRRRQDRPGVHLRHHHGEGLRRPDPDHQDRLGRQVAAHRLPPAQRRALRLFNAEANCSQSLREAWHSQGHRASGRPTRPQAPAATTA